MCGSVISSAFDSTVLSFSAWSWYHDLDHGGPGAPVSTMPDTSVSLRDVSHVSFVLGSEGPSELEGGFLGCPGCPPRSVLVWPANHTPSGLADLLVVVL